MSRNFICNMRLGEFPHRVWPRNDSKITYIACEWFSLSVLNAALHDNIYWLNEASTVLPCMPKRTKHIEQFSISVRVSSLISVCDERNVAEFRILKMYKKCDLCRRRRMLILQQHERTSGEKPWMMNTDTLIAHKKINCNKSQKNKEKTLGIVLTSWRHEEQCVRSMAVCFCGIVYTQNVLLRWWLCVISFDSQKKYKHMLRMTP